MPTLSSPAEEGEGEGGLSVADAQAEFERRQAVADRMDKLEQKARWLDAEFQIPRTQYRVGVSSIVGLLPGGGDGVMALVATSIVYRGIRLGASTGTLLKMSFILLVEAIVSVVPIAGDLVGLLWSANVNNVGRLRREQADLPGSTNWWFVLLLLSPWLLFVLGVVSVL